MIEYSEDRQLLTVDEETAILRFIDNFAALGFPLRLHMLEEKALLLLLRMRCKNPPKSLGHNWTTRFLHRHSEYRTKFPRHLNQSRHWNSAPEVFSNWLQLYRRTCDRYGIANGDQYNMDEKGYMMRIGGKVK